jgi:hypothetical protein
MSEPEFLVVREYKIDTGKASIIGQEKIGQIDVLVAGSIGFASVRFTDSIGRSVAFSLPLNDWNNIAQAIKDSTYFANLARNESQIKIFTPSQSTE